MSEVPDVVFEVPDVVFEGLDVVFEGQLAELAFEIQSILKLHQKHKEGKKKHFYETTDHHAGSIDLIHQNRRKYTLLELKFYPNYSGTWSAEKLHGYFQL